MSEQVQFLETVKVVNGEFIHPEYNLQRMKQAMNEVFRDLRTGYFFQGYCYSRTNEARCGEMPYSVWQIY